MIPDGCCVFRWMVKARLLLLLLLFHAITGTFRRSRRVPAETNLTVTCLAAAAVASQCRQGATFSQAVVTPDVESSGIVRVPGAVSLPQCVAACCDLPGYDLAWLFEGRCYVLSCQQRANCRPRERAGADSVLVFLRRASPQTLILQSLVRGEPYGGRWRASSLNLEDPGNLESLRDLALLQGAQQDPPETRTQENLEGSPEETGQGPDAPDQPPAGHSFNQSGAEEGAGPGQGRAGSDVDQSRATTSSPGSEGGPRSPAEPPTHRHVSGGRGSTPEVEPHPSFSAFTFRPTRRSAPVRRHSRQLLTPPTTME